jgi:hypothetical protein
MSRSDSSIYKIYYQIIAATIDDETDEPFWRAFMNGDKK